MKALSFRRRLDRLDKGGGDDAYEALTKLMAAVGQPPGDTPAAWSGLACRSGSAVFDAVYNAIDGKTLGVPSARLLTKEQPDASKDPSAAVGMPRNKRWRAG